MNLLSPWIAYALGQAILYPLDGFVYSEGRIRRVIVRRGFKISVYTIEDIINKHKVT